MVFHKVSHEPGGDQQVGNTPARFRFSVSPSRYGDRPIHGITTRFQHTRRSQNICVKTFQDPIWAEAGGTSMVQAFVKGILIEKLQFVQGKYDPCMFWPGYLY
jgi:hypothetical protein